MGKFPNSVIHDRYSDWHWNLTRISDKYKCLVVADIDRLWIEYDLFRKAIVAIIDIKWEESGDGITTTEKGIYEWFESKGARVYTVFIARDFTRFRVINWEGLGIIFSPMAYADWLLSLRGGDLKNKELSWEKLEENIEREAELFPEYF
jgi:hypothetical protein